MTVGELRQADQLPPTLTVEEAGQLLGISRRSAYRAVERGEIPSLRLGRLLRVPTVKLLDLIGFGADAATAGPTGDHVDGSSSASLR